MICAFCNEEENNLEKLETIYYDIIYACDSCRVKYRGLISEIIIPKSPPIIKADPFHKHIVNEATSILTEISERKYDIDRVDIGIYKEKELFDTKEFINDKNLRKIMLGCCNCKFAFNKFITQDIIDKKADYIYKCPNCNHYTKYHLGKYADA